ncbi:imelysin family protein [Olleya sp. HaHaR_3_96]|uniref:imelysin family protein n=1 Tax=Olleya sp. HaHaR_3_96 TaxID=2745560 RepID=UPI001C4F61D8|nr:imelysin family protein [Olleya sp. HaHaR_3_96]QXP61736.1 imelysin family protein [Olleya sp. HaHaR_3_96]
MKNIYKALLLICLFALSCNSDDDQQEDVAFNVMGLLEDVTNYQILPSVANFETESNTLNTTIVTYLNTLTEANLNLTKDQLKITAKAYANIYAFNIGTIRDQFMHLALYNWPTLPSALENVINDNDAITEELLATKSPQIKTLSALEYLLFNADSNTVNTQFVDDVKRQDYLKYTALDLKSQSERLLGLWNSPGNYATTFIDNNDTGIRDSFNRLYNGLYNLIDTGKVTKIGKPAGLENSQINNPELTQAYFSSLSLTILKENINSVKNVYFNTAGIGIDDYVYHVIKNNDLNQAVENKIEDVQNAIDAIPVPLFDAITSHPDLVAHLHTELDALGILFSVDVRSILSIIITSTDNDGD